MLGIKGYVEAKRKRDMLWLLQSIKDTVYQFDKVKPSKLSTDDALERILKFHQGNLELAEFHKTFVNYIKVYEENAGYFSVTSKDILQLQKDLKDKGLSTDDYNLQFTEGIQDLRDHAVGIAFLKRADKSKYLELQNNLQYNYLNGVDDYPNNIAEALDKLTFFKSTLPVLSRHQPSANALLSHLVPT